MATSYEWDGKEIDIQRVWNTGGQTFLVRPNGQNHAKFTLKRLDAVSGQPRYVLTHLDGYASPFLDSATLKPCGSTDLPKVPPLPPWKDKDQPTEDAYAKGLTDLVDELGNDATQVRRLEGNMIVLFNTHLRIDRIRIVNVPGVITASSGPPTDLAVVQLSFADGGGFKENGGGSGPPK